MEIFIKALLQLQVSAIFVADEKHLQSANLIARSGDSMHKNIEQLRFEEELITL